MSVNDPPLARPPASAQPDDLDREVYCVLGMPIDSVDMATVLERIDAAARRAAPYLISTPNLNFLVACRRDPAFRKVLLRSDLCTADGMPIIWIARLMGLPIRTRVAGADVFEALSSRTTPVLKVFLFGSTAESAAAAERRLNTASRGLYCVGAMSPGFGSIEDLSTDETITKLNASGADFLSVSLGAKKGQAWLDRNHDRVRIPVRAHLGATINFQSGSVRRAPAFFSRVGLEWLWRIKEEPTLWRRYWQDGCVLLRLSLTHVLPLATFVRWHTKAAERRSSKLTVERLLQDGTLIFRLAGAATACNIGPAIAAFRATSGAQAVAVDLTEVEVVDARFMGLLLMLRKRLRQQDGSLSLVGISLRMKRTLQLHGADFMLEEAVQRNRLPG